MFGIKNGKIVWSGLPTSRKVISNVAQGALTGEVTVYEQTVLRDSTNTVGTLLNFTAANTHTAQEVFSNTGGIKTDAIVENTAGNGTPIKSFIRTVSNPTLTSATTPAISASTSGATYTFAAAAVTVTLPACSATNIGLKFRFVTTTIATAQIINTTGTDVFLGGVFSTLSIVNATNDTFFGTSTANKTMTMNGTTTGGLPGSSITVECISATQWLVTGFVVGASGTQATLFSN